MGTWVSNVLLRLCRNSTNLHDANVKVIYLIGALKNPQIPEITNYLTGLGFEVFSDWWAASEDADDWLRDYYKGRGYNYKQTLGSYAAQHIFEFDRTHLDRADIGVMVMPAGKSGHLELGYMIGQGKPGYILFDKEPERVDIMHNFATEVFFNRDELGQTLSRIG